jgi:hypothetical protein
MTYSQYRHGAVATPGLDHAPAPQLGIVIAVLVLLPETWAAVRAAHATRLQSSLNLALGSALSSIGHMIPAVAVTSTVVGLPLVLGLDSKELVLLVLTFGAASITPVSGRTHALLGAVRLVIFAAFLSWLSSLRSRRRKARAQLRFAFFSFFAARFSSSDFAGFFFCSFFRSIPLLMIRAPD